MVTKQFWLIPLTVLTIATASGSVSARGNTGSMPTSPTEVFKRSILFVENAGQWPEAARFQVWGSPAGVGTTWLTEDAIWISIVVGSHSTSSAAFPKELPNPQLAGTALATPTPAGLALKLTFPDSNPDVRIEPFDPLTTTVSYFLDNDPNKWYPAVPVYGGVRYADLYPGIDLEITSAGGQWSWRLSSSTLHENPEAPRRLGVGLNGQEGSIVPGLHFEGADSLTSDGAGLHLNSRIGELILTPPWSILPVRITGPTADGQSIDVTVRPVVMRPSFRMPTNDPADLLYSTFLGGSVSDTGEGIAVDHSGHAYVTGFTWSGEFPSTPGAFDITFNGGDRTTDAFVTRLNAAGSALDYATFLGGNHADHGYAVAVDSAGRAYVTGDTWSNDFPSTPGAFDPTFNPGYDTSDAFAVRLSADGSALDYATFLGASGMETGHSMVLDNGGRTYLTGWTNSRDFPTTPGAFDTSYNGGDSDAFVVRLDATGSTLDYATFFGGSNGESGNSLALDSRFQVYVTGNTWSDDFPTTPGTFDTSFNGGYCDVFIVRFSAPGSDLSYATFLGGNGMDFATGMKVDSSDQAFVAGETRSSDFPVTLGAYDTSLNGDSDSFVARLNANGSTLEYATFLGGSAMEARCTLALDRSSRAYVTGYTGSGDFPTTPGAFDTSFNEVDGFVARLNTNGDTLDYATFLGGSGGEGGHAIALDSSNQVYVTGDTGSSDFPTSTNAFDTSHNGASDVFVSKLHLTPYVPEVLALIEQPLAGAFITGTVNLSGFAIDLGSPTGTGIDRVHIYLDGPYGTGTIIGSATYGLDRPDIAAQYGARFGPSGWELAWDTSTTAPGVHSLYLYTHRTIDNRWSLMAPRLVIVRADHVCWLPLGYRSEF